MEAPFQKSTALRNSATGSERDLTLILSPGHNFFKTREESHVPSTLREPTLLLTLSNFWPLENAYK